MIIEYILLLTAFVFMLMKVSYQAPATAFKEAGPKLGVRIEKHLITGTGFAEAINGQSGDHKATWETKPR